MLQRDEKCRFYARDFLLLLLLPLLLVSFLGVPLSRKAKERREDRDRRLWNEEREEEEERRGHLFFPAESSCAILRRSRRQVRAIISDAQPISTQRGTHTNLRPLAFLFPPTSLPAQLLSFPMTNPSGLLPPPSSLRRPPHPSPPPPAPPSPWKPICKCCSVGAKEAGKKNGKRRPRVRPKEEEERRFPPTNAYLPTENLPFHLCSTKAFSLTFFARRLLPPPPSAPSARRWKCKRD